MTITFTDERTTALNIVFNVASGETLENKIQTYLNNIADVQIETSLDETFKTKSKAEKEALLS